MHVTPGKNGYVESAGKQIAAIRAKAEAEAEAKRKIEEAEHFAKRYLNDHPETVILTGYEQINPFLAER